MWNVCVPYFPGIASPLSPLTEPFYLPSSAINRLLVCLMFMQAIVILSRSLPSSLSCRLADSVSAFRTQPWSFSSSPGRTASLLVRFSSSLSLHPAHWADFPSFLSYFSASLPHHACLQDLRPPSLQQPVLILRADA